MKKADMRKKTCCFTGHRNIPPKEYESVKIRLREAIITAIENGYRYRYFGAGGALGFDTLAAQIVLDLKKQYPHIFLILCCLAGHKQSSGKRRILPNMSVLNL